MIADDRTPFDTTLFVECETIAELQKLLISARKTSPRKYDFVLMMAAQGRTKRALIAEFGRTGPTELDQFNSKYPTLSHYAEECNLVCDPHFACAAVRAFRNSQV